jgi:hypothetical protein
VDRRDKAFAHIDLNGRGLEIGASHSPLLPKSSGAHVEIVDHASRPELIEKYRVQGIGSDLLARIEEVDHIWTHGSLADAVGERGAFDYIIGSHMIEHMVDLIGFLQDCEALLRDGGRLSLIIPDKRYCFDMFQPLTTVGGAVNGHLSGIRLHPFGTVLDHHAYACLRGPEVISWNSATSTPVQMQFDDLRTKNEEIERGRRQEDYVDVHRWRFTPTSFRLLLQDLRDLGYHRLAEVGWFDTAGNEFFVTLARTDVTPPREDRLAMLLRIDQELRSAVEPVVTAAELKRSEEEAATESERLNAALAASEQAAQDLRFALSASERTAEDFRLALSANERTAEDFRLALSASERTLAGVLASKSWRATVPLRALTHAIKRPGR